MDEVTYFKTRFRKEQWEKLITDCQSSSLKVDDWCVQNHISRHAYYYWLRKIRKEACESILPTFPKRENEVTFAKLEVQSTKKVTRAEAAILIHLSCATLEVLEGTSQRTVETVLLALKNIC